jgi:hypothetical protein
MAIELLAGWVFRVLLSRKPGFMFRTMDCSGSLWVEYHRSSFSKEQKDEKKIVHKDCSLDGKVG